jgi:MFS family permease
MEEYRWARRQRHAFSNFVSAQFLDRSRLSTQPTSPANSATNANPPTGFLASFHYRSFRFQWTSDGMYNSGQEMEALMLSWFILTETGSPFLVGLLGALRFGGTLGGPFYGLLGDRMDRRKLLIMNRGLIALLASVTFLLAFTDLFEAWHAFVIALLLGAGRMMDNVVRQSLIADVVPRVNLLNAVGLSRTMQDGAKIAGAIAGGVLLARLGLGNAYIIVIGLYASATLIALGISIAERTSTAKAKNPLSDLKSGLTYIKDNDAIVGMMFLAMLVNLTTFPMTNGLMPVMARDVFNSDEEGLAALLSAAAIGAALGSVSLAALGRTRRSGRVMLIGIVVWHLAILVLAQVESFPVALVVLVVVGACSSASMVSMSALLLTTTNTQFRGRVMGVRSLAVWTLQPGLLFGGYMAGRFDIAFTFTVMGILGLVLVAFAIIRWPGIWRDVPNA